MLRGFFVTGTDTGVGKTVVSTILSVGLQAKYWKPIQTGTCENTDSDFLRKWIGPENVHPEAYKLLKPASPHEAAAEEHVEITLETLLTSAPKSKTLTIVEGAGGVLVPLNTHLLMVDLIHALSLPALVVCRSSLGTINHTLMTLETLRSRGVEIFGVVMVGDRNDSNAKAIQSYGNVKVLGRIPHTPFFSRQWFVDSSSLLSYSHAQELMK